MAIIKGWSFDSKHGFSGSTGNTVEVKGYRRGGPVKGPTRFSKDEDADDKAAPVNELAEGGRPHYRKGGIHIKPENKGKFTQKMTGSKHGHLTGKDVSRGLHSSSPETRKEANFARMARRHFKPLAKGGHVGAHKTDPDPGAKGGPDLDVTFPGNHLAYKKGGHLKPHGLHGHQHFPDHHGHEHLGHGGMTHHVPHVRHKAKGGGVCSEPEKMAGGGMMMKGRPMGMPRSPVIGMKRTRHPLGMPGAAGAMPNVPGLPSPGTAPMGIPGAPGSPPRVMRRGGKSK